MSNKQKQKKRRKAYQKAKNYQKNCLPKTQRGMKITKNLGMRILNKLKKSKRYAKINSTKSRATTRSSKKPSSVK